MADSPTVWRLDDLMKAAMAGVHDVDTEEQFAEQTFQGVTVCARRVHQSDAHRLAFYDSASEEQSLTQVFHSIDKLEENIKRQARVWYHSFTDNDISEWNEMYQKLPHGPSLNRFTRGDESHSDTDDDSFTPYD